MEDTELMFYGLLLAALVFMSLGSAGLGTGGSFNAWGGFLDVIGAVAVLNIVIGVINFAFVILPAIWPVLLALFGAYVFSKSADNIGLGSFSAISELITTPAAIVFIILLVLLL
ncbi:hypothetical protein HZC09_03280 [Candidatus Micrarchaeota archaeon]|nr:hypothetical protein [Candidatus Micrarchaeota archaeon]